MSSSSTACLARFCRFMSMPGKTSDTRLPGFGTPGSASPGFTKRREAMGRLLPFSLTSSSSGLRSGTASSLLVLDEHVEDDLVGGRASAASARDGGGDEDCAEQEDDGFSHESLPGSGGRPPPEW